MINCGIITFTLSESGINIPDPGFIIFSVLDLGDPRSKNNEKGREIKLVVFLFFSHKLHKTVNYFISEQVENTVSAI